MPPRTQAAKAAVLELRAPQVPRLKLLRAEALLVAVLQVLGRSVACLEDQEAPYSLPGQAVGAVWRRGDGQTAWN